MAAALPQCTGGVDRDAATIRLPDGGLADRERLPSWAAFLAELRLDAIRPTAPDW
jgi:hypothetical protein